MVASSCFLGWSSEELYIDATKSTPEAGPNPELARHDVRQALCWQDSDRDCDHDYDDDHAHDTSQFR